MDDADRAEDLIKHAIEDGIEEARRGPPGPEAIGYCLFCGTPLLSGRRWCGPACQIVRHGHQIGFRLLSGRRWCGPACRDDWQAEQDARLRKKGGR